MARRLIGCLLPLALIGAGALPATAQQAQQGEERPAGDAPAQPGDAALAALKERLASELGVDVLDVRPVEANGRPVYAVKVMIPGGNSNDAFLVSTLVVDRESGEVLGRLPQPIETAAGFSKSGAQFEPDLDDSGQAMRRRTYR
jgi:hypothetical protein